MTRVVSRRGLLATAVVIAGAGAGTAAGLARPLSTPPPPTVPQPLSDAVERERTLIARLDAAITAGNADRRLAVVRADHAAHLDVLRAKVQDIVRPTATPTPAPLPSAPAAGIPELKAAEHAAADAATAASAQLAGDIAVVLASIAACEATHAELLA